MPLHPLVTLCSFLPASASAMNVVMCHKMLTPVLLLYFSALERKSVLAQCNAIGVC